MREVAASAECLGRSDGSGRTYKGVGRSSTPMPTRASLLPLERIFAYATRSVTTNRVWDLILLAVGPRVFVARFWKAHVEAVASS